MHHSYSERMRVLGRFYRRKFSVDVNVSLIGVINARKHIHKRGFTASVFAEQRQNFAFINVKRNAAVCLHFSEGFADVFKFNGYLLFSDCKIVRFSLHSFTCPVKIIYPRGRINYPLGIKSIGFL